MTEVQHSTYLVSVQFINLLSALWVFDSDYIDIDVYIYNLHFGIEKFGTLRSYPLIQYNDEGCILGSFQYIPTSLSIIKTQWF